MFKSSSYRVAAAAFSSALLSTTSLAQTGDNEAQEEIVVVSRVLYSDRVSALKTPTLIIDVPQSLTITTADEIIKRGFTSVGEIITYTPGVNTSQGEGHRDAIVFRGVRSTADFFIDGVRDDAEYFRPLYNLEQVEILRGPNALLFGRGGTGGILNRVTKKGVFGEDFVGYVAGVDTFGEFGFQVDANISKSDKAAYRINAMYENLNNHRDFYAGERFGINPTGRFKLTPTTTFDVSYEYVNHQRFIDRGIPTGADGRPVEAFQDIVFGDPELNTTELEAHLIRAAIQHDFSDNLRGNVSAFYGDYDKLYQNFYASRYDQALTPGEVELDGYVDTTQRQNLVLAGNMFGEFSTGTINHSVVVGAEYINTSSDQNRFNSFWDSTMDDNEIFAIARPLNLRGGMGVNASGIAINNSFTADLNDDTRVNIDVFSAYLQDEVQLTDWLNVVVGLRYDSFDIEVFDVPGDMTRTRTDQEISPRFGVILKPQQNISIYASYGESFLPRSGDQFANINGENNQLDPNTFTNLEAGVKWDINPGLSLTAAIFEIEQSSPQVADNDPETLDVIDSKIQGFEVQLQGQLMDWWFVTAGYSFLDGEQVNRMGPTGLRPRELPESMFSMWHNFQVTNKIGLGVGLTHQSESFVNNGNSAVLPGYTRIDAAAFYDVSDKVRVQVNIENLTDALYFPNAHATHQVTVAAPVNARFSITGRF